MGLYKFLPSTIPVFIVAGPPASGKTSYVEKHRRHGDLVVDVDALFVALSGGLPFYDKPQTLLPFVMEARDAVIARLARESDVAQAWVITGESSKYKLRQMQTGLGDNAKLIVITKDLSTNECMKRIYADPRRAGQAELWRPLVADWWQRWQDEEWPDA